MRRQSDFGSHAVWVSMDPPPPLHAQCTGLGALAADVKHALAQLHALRTAQHRTDSAIADLQRVIGVRSTPAQAVPETTLVQTMASIHSAIDVLLARECHLCSPVNRRSMWHRSATLCESRGTALGIAAPITRGACTSIRFATKRYVRQNALFPVLNICRIRRRIEPSLSILPVVSLTHS